MDLSLYRIFCFIKFYSLRNSGLQVTDIQNKICRVFLEVVIRLATKWLGILSLGGIDKIRNHLVANLKLQQY